MILGEGSLFAGRELVGKAGRKQASLTEFSGSRSRLEKGMGVRYRTDLSISECTLSKSSSIILILNFLVSKTKKD